MLLNPLLNFSTLVSNPILKQIIIIFELSLFSLPLDSSDIRARGKNNIF